MPTSLDGENVGWGDWLADLLGGVIISTVVILLILSRNVLGRDFTKGADR